jgi:hypothetical protein
MNACPNDGVLLQFLDGKLNAEDEAMILAHLEDCPGCQEHLERLTGDRPLSGEGSPVETVQTDLASAKELNDAKAPQADDADRMATASGADPETDQVRRKPAPADWPIIPGYDVLQRLGEGGMGVVYKARHRPLNRTVALKMISEGKHDSSEHRERFLIEAEAVARLRHPNIVQIYDFGEADGQPFVTLEWLEGGSLADRLKGTTQPAFRHSCWLPHSHLTASRSCHDESERIM